MTLFTEYKEWAERNGFAGMSIIKFGKRLQGLGYKKKRGHSEDVYPLVVHDGSHPGYISCAGVGGAAIMKTPRYKM